MLVDDWVVVMDHHQATHAPIVVVVDDNQDADPEIQKTVALIFGHAPAGQDADPETGITRGVQVSTFDVVDPTAPSRIDVDVTPDSNSEVEWEPLALTVTDDRLAVVPVEIWNAGPNGRLGALLYRVSGNGELQRVGMLNSGGDWQLRPRRTLDLGDQLLTIGERGVIAWDRDDFRVLDTVRFGAPAFEGFEQEFGEDDGGAPGGDPGFDERG